MNTLAIFDMEHLPILLIIGFALFMGGMGARLFQKLRIPQVVGYIVIGVILGRSGLGLFKAETIDQMRLFNFFALGIIGFMIGGELRFDVFRKYGKQFLIILLGEGMTAFFVVASLVTVAAWLLTGQWLMSLSIGLVLGAIASATAPAATVDVLWEYKTRGPLTTAVFALVAMDDGLALILYGISASVARNLLGQAGNEGLLHSLGQTSYELIGAVVLGVVVGFGLNAVLRLVRDHGKVLTFILGALIVVIGLAHWAEVDVILSAMALGMAVVNLAPRRSLKGFQIVERFCPPIYVLFFVIVGARLSIDQMQGWMWMLAVVYVVGRTGGKMLGAFLGAKFAHASTSVQKYLGLCLFSQAGVAIGLAILASESFPSEVGNAVIMIVTATTFLVQIIGPPCVKLAVHRAGEVGLNVTREDLVAAYKVADVMDKKTCPFYQGDTYAHIMKTIGKTDALNYPVIDDDNRLLGVITISDLKNVIGRTGLGDLLVAYDLMQPPADTARQSLPLTEALTRMEEQDLDYLPVVIDNSKSQHETPVLVGWLERRRVLRRISREMLQRQEQAVNHEQTQVLREAIAKKRSGRSK